MKKLALILIIVINIFSFKAASAISSNSDYKVSVFTNKWPQKAEGAKLTFIDAKNPSKTKTIVYDKAHYQNGPIEINSTGSTTILKINYHKKTSYCTIEAGKFNSCSIS